MSVLEPKPEIFEPLEGDLHVIEDHLDEADAATRAKIGSHLNAVKDLLGIQPEVVTPPTTDEDLHHVAQSTAFLARTLNLIPEEKQALDYVFGLTEEPADSSYIDDVRSFVWDSYDLTLNTNYDNYTQIEKNMFEVFRSADKEDGKWLSYNAVEKRLSRQLAASEMSFGRVVALGLARLSAIRVKMLNRSAETAF